MALKVVKFYFNASLWSPTRQQWCYLVSCLPKTDCDYVHRFKFKVDCKIRLLSQLLIRYSIKQLVDTSWNEIGIERTANGKPYYVNHRENHNLDFNISHANDYVIICAIKSPMKYQIGVDIMKIDNIDPEKLNRISKKAFSQTERLHTESKTTEIDKSKAFYRYWTLKESYVKAIGEGIRLELNKIDFKIQSELNQDHEIISDTCLNINPHCNFYEQTFDNYITSICLHGTKEPINELKTTNFKPLFIEDLLQTAINHTEPEPLHWEIYEKKE